MRPWTAAALVLIVALMLFIVVLVVIKVPPVSPAYLVPVTVTAYNPVPNQTDDTPHITASNKTVDEGMAALSRDLEKQFGFKFGDQIKLLGIGEYQFEDRMHRRWKRKVDILMFSKAQAKEFGKKKAQLVVE